MSTASKEQTESLDLSGEKKIRIAILASGSGSNFEALALALQEGVGKELGALLCLICDQPGAYVLKRAHRHQIPSYCIPKAGLTKAEHEGEILSRLAKLQVDLILLAGYMRLLSANFVAKYPERILNIHPALLPGFKGAHAIQDAFAAGVSETGVTVHVVDEEMDHGPIIRQCRIPIEADDSLESLAARIHQREHLLYVDVLYDYLLAIKRKEATHAQSIIQCL